jgi:hypothetical protein
MYRAASCIALVMANKSSKYIKMILIIRIIEAEQAATTETPSCSYQKRMQPFGVTRCV